MQPLNNVFSTDLDAFENQVIQASQQKLILVDLWAEWCSPCRVIAPLLEKIAAEFHDTLAIAKVEVDEDENMKLAGRYTVRGFPTLILFKKGVEVGRFSGAKPLSFIRDFIDEHSD